MPISTNRAFDLRVVLAAEGDEVVGGVGAAALDVVG
jgi:hypothetical protein